MWSFWRFICGAKIKIYHLKTIWMELCERSGYFFSLSLTLSTVWHERDVRLCLRPSFCDPQYHLINLRQQLLHRRQRPVYVRKLFDKLFRSKTLSWRKTLIKTLSSSLNTIVCNCLLNSDVSMMSINIAGSLEELVVCTGIWNKKALLSQRRPRDAPYIWMPWKISRVPGYAHGYFSRNC